MVAFAPARIGLLVAGFEVPHVHLHVVPVSSMDQLNFANAAAHPEPADLDEAEQRLVAAIAANRHPPGD